MHALCEVIHKNAVMLTPLRGGEINRKKELQLVDSLRGIYYVAGTTGLIHSFNGYLHFRG